MQKNEVGLEMDFCASTFKAAVSIAESIWTVFPNDFKFVVDTYKEALKGVHRGQEGALELLRSAALEAYIIARMSWEAQRGPEPEEDWSLVTFDAEDYRLANAI